MSLEGSNKPLQRPKWYVELRPNQKKVTVEKIYRKSERIFQQPVKPHGYRSNYGTTKECV